jgi:hypothetical protein
MLTVSLDCQFLIAFLRFSHKTTTWNKVQKKQNNKRLTQGTHTNDQCFLKDQPFMLCCWYPLCKMTPRTLYLRGNGRGLLRKIWRYQKEKSETVRTDKTIQWASSYTAGINNRAWMAGPSEITGHLYEFLVSIVYYFVSFELCFTLLFCLSILSSFHLSDISHDLTRWAAWRLSL